MDSINMIGKPCPIPVIEAKKALRAAAPGDSINMLVDNDIARQNLQKMAEGMGYGFSHEVIGDGNILVRIEARAKAAPSGDTSSGLVVAIGRDSMGAGDDTLGKMLMKSFIYSLTELDTPPVHLLFFNGGVRLTTEGSAALADLRTLAERGVDIDSCGACLNFYDLTDKLQIGGVTNMFSIVGIMSQAKKLINL